MRDDLVYLTDILSAIEDIEEFTLGYDREKFSGDKKTFQAVIRELEIIGEAVKNLSSILKDEYENVPWREIAGMRDKLIHGYFGVKINLIWKTIIEDVPTFKTEIVKIIGKYKDNI